MNTDNELLQLAHLLRVGAETAHTIAEIRTHDADAICQMVDQAKAMADELERIVANAKDDNHRHAL